jgi:hypothetical protein
MMTTPSIHRCLEGIAGLERDPQYAGGERGGSPLADELRRLLEGANWDALNAAQRDHLGRILAAAQEHVKRLWMDRRFTRREWKPGPKSPACAKTPWRFWEFNQDDRPWLDHLIRLIDKDTGTVYYVSEPYQIHEEAILRLAQLAQDGWQVWIDASMSTHFPGQTVAVLVSRRPESVERTTHDGATHVQGPGGAGAPPATLAR